ncbi:GNAT family N-acetyltransferase [Streptococcus chenjunshii]|nr:GNAT family N-acetyltransferase [Streptococcus chenjunshii]
MLDALDASKVEAVLKTFKSISLRDERHDVEIFLHQKAIEFEKTAIASTYLVFDEETNVLLGFFSLANKPLTMNKRNFERLSKTQQKKLKSSGRLIGDKYQVISYLIGQLGKNYSQEAISNGGITGEQLLTLAYNKVIEASRIIKAKYVWLECENIEYLESFYSNFGFQKIPNYVSDNNLSVMLLKIK